MAFSKQRRATGNPLALPKPATHFEPLPPQTVFNLLLPLGAVLPELPTPAATGKIVFHSVGDTGGVHGTDTQTAIAEAMEAQIKQAAVDAKPAFMFHLGDVVYYNGISTDYPQQFYEPYQYYPAPIFAIPGNHDCDTGVRGNDPPDTEASMFGFMQNFCSPSARRNSPYRDTMTQPYCYWVLTAPFMHIIGLHSNVDGELDGRGTVQQQAFLQEQMKATPRDKWLIVAVHHPCYSLDTTHGGYPPILAALDKAAAVAGRWPDAVLSGHVHNYQRFSRRIDNALLPYIVAGAGGYANRAGLMHQLQKDGDFSQLPFATTEQGVSLEAYNCDDPGYLRVTAGSAAITFEYFTVPFDGSAPPDAPFDHLTLHPHTPKTP